jgi:ATP-dependent Zn protease
MQQVREILQQYWQTVEAVAQALLDRETLQREELLALCGRRPVPTLFYFLEHFDAARRAA